GGGAKVGTLLAMPSAKGLFHRAICQSGPPVFENDREGATKVALSLLRELSIKPNGIEKLQELPGPVLLAAYKRVVGGDAGKGIASYAPVVDGITLPASLSDPVSQRLMPSVPVMVGNVRDESVQFVNADQMPSWGVSPGENFELQLADDRELRDFIMSESPVLGNRTVEEVDQIVLAYRKGEPGSSRVRLLMEITTDAFFWRKTLRYADQRRAQASGPVFYYEFRWRTPCYGSEYSPHGVEIPFVFDNMSYSYLFDEHDTPATRAAADPTGIRFTLRDQIVTAWTHFARTGSPSSISLPWTHYDGSGHSVMTLGTKSGVSANAWSAHRQSLFNMLGSA
ncbi:MAG: carboxylesterase family protein, partial [Janthinobacterium lividum]